MKRIYIKFCIIQTKRIQHNIINRITFIKIIHPRKPAISLSYPYRFNNLLTPSSPTLFKTILPQTSPQIFPSNRFYAIARSNESSKDFFYDPILNNTRSPSNIRETKKDSPFPFPFSPSPPPSRFSTGWLFFKTKKRQNEQVASIIPACTLKLPRFFSSPAPSPHNKGVLARATDRANFKYRVFLKHSGKRVGR